MNGADATSYVPDCEIFSSCWSMVASPELEVCKQKPFCTKLHRHKCIYTSSDSMESEIEVVPWRVNGSDETESEFER